MFLPISFLIGIAITRFSKHSSENEVDFVLDIKIHYYYKADETKVKQRVESSSSVIETEYVGPLVYEVVGSTRSLKYIITPEGLAYNNNNTYLYEYHIKDHLGNVRVVLAQDGVIKQTTDYYPYGMKRAKPAPTSRGFGQEPLPPMIICEFHESQLKIKVLDE